VSVKEMVEFKDRLNHEKKTLYGFINMIKFE